MAAKRISPERVSVDPAAFTLVEVLDSGRGVGRVLMPNGSVAGRSPEAVKEAAARIYRALREDEPAFADLHEWASRSEIVDTMLSSAAGFAAGAILSAYLDRAGENGPEARIAVGVMTTKAAQEACVQRARARIKQDLTASLQDLPARSFDIAVQAWTYAAGLAMEQETGLADEAIPAMTERYLGELDSAVLGAILGRHAHEIADGYIRTIAPEKRTLPELRTFLEIDTPADPETNGGGPSSLTDYLKVMSNSPYQALRDALAKGRFEAIEGIPWPTALLDKGTAMGHAQLRPVALDGEQPLMTDEEIDRWSKIMWRQREELSDLDADALDALASVWLTQAKSPQDSAVADIDELLLMRGLKPKRAGNGRRGGFEPEQRAAMLRSVSHIMNIWLNILEVETYEETGKGRSRPVKQSIQSRPFVITDRMGQLRVDGYMDVQKFVFLPGKVFAAFLMGPGRQVALLSAKALGFDPHNQVWEKRLTRYLSWLWRSQAKGGEFLRPFVVRTLLEAAGETLNHRSPIRTKERLEKALDVLLASDVIQAWQYSRWDESRVGSRGWADEWIRATIVIEPPDVIKDHYRRIEQTGQEPTAVPSSPALTGNQIAERRKMLGLSQLQAAEQLGLSQSYLSKLERGKADWNSISVPVQKRLRDWVSGAGA